MRNLFEVGEVVILASINHPAFNAEYRVMDVRSVNFIKCRRCSSPHGYQLNMPDPSIGGYSNYWCECVLKKHYKPGDSFESIMDSLKQPIKQPVMVEQGD